MQKIFLQLAACYLRNTSFERGRYRLVTLARPILRKIGKELGIKRVRTRHGFIMELNLRDWIPQDIYLKGEFESSTSAIAKLLLKPGDTVVDVGANIGYYSLLFSQYVGDTGRIYSFEPAPALVSELEKNVNLNNCRNVEISKAALSDHSGTANFYMGPIDNSGLSSFREPRQSVSSFEVDLKPFDDFVKEKKGITLVKIDVEGAELQVLRGMEKLLRDLRPNLLVEITDAFLKELGDSANSLQAFLKTFDYMCYMIEDGRITYLEETPRELPKQWNALFTHNKMFGKGMTLSQS